MLASFLSLTACGTHVYHQVKKGDTLYSISWRYHQNYQDIAQWNAIQPPYIIHDGQWLRVAPSSAKENRSSGRREAPVRVLSPSAPVTVKDTSSPSLLPAKPVAIKPVSTPPEKPIDQTAHVAVSRPEKVSVSTARTPVKWQWPVSGAVLEGYNAKRPGKAGIAIGGARGSSVRAAAAGKVVYSGNGLKGYGNLIIIMHNEKYLSAYGLNETLLVGEGDYVDSGQAVATLGGKIPGQGELYFEIRIDGKPANPMRYLPKRGS